MNGLKRARVRRDLTQEALARLSGVSRITIARIETGSTASVRTLCQLARALGCTMEELLSQEDTHEAD